MFYNQPEEFLKEEVRDGWTVSETIKRVWAVQLDLISKFIEICNENGLKCFALYGSMLGAVRHGGFIPWDDDVDFGMPREDYDKLLRICEKGLPEPYFLQTTLSDIDCYQIFASFRNSDTTGNSHFTMKKRCNNGIGMDIFPLDGVSSDMKVFQKERRKIKFYAAVGNTYVTEFNSSMQAKVLRAILHCIPGLPYKKCYLKHEEKLRKRKFCESEYVSAVLDTGYQLSKMHWKRSDFDDVIYMPFENIRVPIPSGYEDVLRTTYGNYMEFPPVEERGDKHGIEFATDIPYREYCANKYGTHY